ncbi:MAG: hypothetical protein H6581_29505 [Bacteroidia bacterium]|nr:hypothetical protein [Bacteroidia bacterium]
MSKVVKVYCEGKAGSPDFDLLNKVVSGLNIQIVPIGGKTGAKSAIQVKEEGLSKSEFKLFFRDRDFDAPVPPTEKLTNDGSYVYFSYRTTIENYLLDFKKIEEYSKVKSFDSHDLEKKYVAAAKEIRFFQATRHTLGKLRVPTDFGTNIVSKSGVLPKDLNESFCREAGFEKVSQSIKKTWGWSREHYDKVFDDFLNEFNDKFIESHEFLVYFQGKDFMKSLCGKLPDFSSENYYQYAKSVFRYQDYKDFVELREILERELKK